jgi:secreted PhoX family phosphatase
VTGRDGGGLWRLRFANIENPSLGGTLQLLLDGTEEIAAGEPKLNKPDNMAIDTHGNLLIQEDPAAITTLPASSPPGSATARWAL